MEKDKFIRSIKKDYLIFKSLRKKQHEFLKNGLVSILDDDDFYFIDSEVLQAVYFNAIEKGIRSPAHYNYNKKEAFELDHCGCQKLALINGAEDKFKNAWIFVVPTEWYLCGGFLVSMNVFFSKFLSLSYLMQDDFDIYDSALDNSLEFRGDRSDNELVYCSIVVRGLYFYFVTELEENK
jgi:hypothetical protein